MAIPTTNFALQAPTATLGEYDTTQFTSVPGQNLISISAASLQPYYVYIPTTILGSRFSTFVHTSDAPITISAPSATVTQTWYIS